MTTHAAGHTRPLAERLSTRTLNPKADSMVLPDVAETAAAQAPELRATLTVASAAERLGVSPWLVRRLVASGDPPAALLGRHIVISRARLLAWLDNQQEPPHPGDRASTVSPARTPPCGSEAGWRVPAGRLRTAPNWPGPRASPPNCMRSAAQRKAR